MAKKLFIITSRNRNITDVGAVEQKLLEYDFEVVNPRVIEEYEARKVALGLLDENDGWMKRDIQKLLHCDGAVVFETFTSSDYEYSLYQIAQEFPWIGSNNIKYLDEWIGGADGD